MQSLLLRLSHCKHNSLIFSPQNFWLGRGLPHLFGNEDVPLPQNAPPRLVPLSGDLLRYLSLGTNGLPLLTTLKPGSTSPPAEEEWTDHDYVDLPSHQSDAHVLTVLHSCSPHSSCSFKVFHCISSIHSFSIFLAEFFEC